jgi:hypothetical protein
MDSWPVCRIVVEAEVQVADTATTLLPCGLYETRQRTISRWPPVGSTVPLPLQVPCSGSE